MRTDDGVVAVRLMFGVPLRPESKGDASVPPLHPTLRNPPQPLTTITERVAADELALCARAYKRIAAAQLAPKLGLPSPAAAVEGAWESFVVEVGTAVSVGPVHLRLPPPNTSQTYTQMQTQWRGPRAGAWWTKTRASWSRGRARRKRARAGRGGRPSVRGGGGMF